MKIGFFTDTYLPVTHGVVVSILSFKSAFEEMGHRVYIYAPQAPNYKDTKDYVFRFNSVKIIQEPELRFAFPTFPHQAFTQAKNFKIDIAHAHTPFSMGVLAKYIALQHKIPLIYTHHTHYPEYAKVYFKEKMLLPQLAKAYCGWFANLSDAVIAPSVKIEKLIQGYGLRKDKPVHIVLTGINLNKFKVDDSQKEIIKLKYSIAPNDRLLLYVGRINKEKNVDFLIKAAKYLKKIMPNFVLLMVGDGALRQNLQKHVKSQKLSRYIKFTGLVPYEDICKYYQAADVFVFPSLTDTQGIVLLESMACGTPVITLKDDAFTDVVINERNGYIVDKKSALLFAQKIKQLFLDNQTYQHFVTQSIVTASGYSEKSQAEKLIKVYQDSIKLRKK